MLPTTILETVKEFIIRLVKDENFRTQLQAHAITNTQELFQAAGYRFSQEEFETATLQLLDLKERDELHELTEAELVGAVGGILRRRPRPTQPPTVQPMYGVIVAPPTHHPRPYPQPMYGVVIQPDPIYQPMYGVVVASE